MPLVVVLPKTMCQQLLRQRLMMYLRLQSTLRLGKYGLLIIMFG